VVVPLRLSNVGLGKTHLMTALAHAACVRGHSVRFTTAVEIINTLTAAQRVGSFKREMAKYVRPALLAIDELGYPNPSARQLAPAGR
jgi:DNA replication protein DnaC